MVAAPDGTLFVGTGNEGKVFRVDPQGKGSLFFDSAELEAHALALAPNGGLYVGTSPDGKIYKVDRNGTATTFFSRDDKYIWALAVDAQGQPVRRHRRKGRHLQDHAGRQGRAVLQDERDARDRAGVRQGRQPARRHRHAGQGAADRSGRQGVRAARLAVPGNPRAALRRQGHAVRRRAQRPAGQRRRAGRRPTAVADASPAARSCARRSPSVSAEITSMSIVDVGGSRHRRRRRARIAARPRARVYRIAPDGVWDQLWESRDDSPYDLTFDHERRADHRHRRQGQDLPPRRRSAAADAAGARRAQQVTAFYKDARGRLYYATANPGKLFRAVARARAARHLRVRSARRADGRRPGARSAGAAPRRPAASIELFTRAGNTETPDDTWSAWSAAVHQRRRARRSPARRRATCSGARC